VTLPCRSPGSAFILPHGTRVYNKLMNLIKAEYVARGYQEVITPNVFNLELWKTSGHYDNYKGRQTQHEEERDARHTQGGRSSSLCAVVCGSACECREHVHF